MTASESSAGTDRRHRRLFPGARHLAKRALVRADVLMARGDASMQRWVSVLAGATAGHIVTPTRAVLSSRAEALDFVAHGLVGPGDRVLDIGAGNGRQAIGLLELGIAEYVGLEVIAESVAYGNREFATVGPVRFLHLDVANDMYNAHGAVRAEDAVFPVEDASFDFAVAGSLYTHFERLPVAERYLAETARALKPGARAYVSFFRSPPNKKTASAVRTVFAEEDIRHAVERHFVIDAALGGTSTDWHDQWRLYLTRR